MCQQYPCGIKGQDKGYAEDRDVKMAVDGRFWEEKKLSELTNAEWESLCDGCGKCCLNKIEDEDTGEYFYTSVACRLLDLKSCRCTAYAKRRKLVRDCVSLTPKKISTLKWLPTTCSYRLIEEGKPLPHWHHLISGSRRTVHQLGISVRGKVFSEDKVKELEDHIVQWAK